MKHLYRKWAVQIHLSLLRFQNKLAERRGASDYVAVLVLVLIVVVVGGILMALFGDTIKEVWQTIKTRIMDLFNYT